MLLLELPSLRKKSFHDVNWHGGNIFIGYNLIITTTIIIAGGKVNWISKSDEEIISATMTELARLFPTEVTTITTTLQ